MDVSSSIKWNLDELNKYSNRLVEDVARLTEAGAHIQYLRNGDLGKAAGLKKADFMGQLHHISSSKYSETSNSFYGNKQRSAEETVEAYLAHVEELFQKSKEAHEANLEGIATNKAIQEAVNSLMASVGIPASYETYGYKTSRSRNQTMTKHTAGFVEDLDRCCETNDGFKSAERVYKEAKAKATEWKEQKLKEERAEQAKKDAAKKKEEALVKTGVLAVKYGLEIGSSADDVLDAILKKNKYLRLAHYLQENRNDWTDGPSFAEAGLSGFTTNCELDNKICTCISELIENWDGDGRVFRDCEYDYNTIFSLCTDEELNKDYDEITSLIEY